MRYFKLISIVLVCSAGVGFADAPNTDDKETDEAIKSITDFSLKAKEDAKKYKDMLKAKEDAEKLAKSGRLDWLKGVPTEKQRESLIKEEGKDSLFAEGFKAIDQANKSSEQEDKYPEDATYVFVSLSMPKSALKAMFSEAVYGNKKIIFVTRGWKQKEFKKTLTEFVLLFPSKQDKRLMPAMLTDPTLFKSLDIDAVPAFAHKKYTGEWSVVYGNSDIDSAIEYIENEGDLTERLGQVFPIEEPDLIEEIQRSIKSYDPSDRIEDIKKNIFKEQQLANVPDARTNDEYLVDMSIQVNKNITANNTVYARKGDRINPLDLVSVNGQYVFADVTKQSHLNIIRSWKKQYPLLKVMSLKLPEETEKRKSLSGEFGYIGLINKLVVKRFKLKGLPSIAWQEGRKMNVKMRNPNE